jgi:sugar-specific transcriptional regulator TrmB
VRARELAQAAHIPLGSIHAILGSLEKKNLIQTKRPGSMKAAAIYEVLETSSQGDVAINDDLQDNGASEA